MNLYEHTIVTRQDTTASQIKQLTEKYSKIVEKTGSNWYNSGFQILPVGLQLVIGYVWVRLL